MLESDIRPSQERPTRLRSARPTQESAWLDEW
jgi:hypothetical protein